MLVPRLAFLVMLLNSGSGGFIGQTPWKIPPAYQTQDQTKGWENPCPEKCVDSVPLGLITHFYSNKKTGFDARDFCHSLGGRLIVVSDEIEEHLANFWGDVSKGDGVWIGGMKLPSAANAQPSQCQQRKDLTNSYVDCSAFKGVVCEFLSKVKNKKCSDQCVQKFWHNKWNVINYYWETQLNYADSEKWCNGRGGEMQMIDPKHADYLPLPSGLVNSKNKGKGKKQPNSYFIKSTDFAGCKTLSFGDEQKKNKVDNHNCHDKLPFICGQHAESSVKNIQAFTSVTMNDGWYYGYPFDCVQYLGSCFLFVREKRSRSYADIYCASLGGTNLEKKDTFNTTWPYLLSFLWLTASTNSSLKDDFQFLGEMQRQGNDGSGNGRRRRGLPIFDQGPGAVESAFICEFILCPTKPPVDVFVQNMELLNPDPKDGFFTYQCAKGYTVKNLYQPTDNANCTAHGVWTLPTCTRVFSRPEPCDENVALNKPTVQSSIEDGHASANAVDGNTADVTYQHNHRRYHDVTIRVRDDDINEPPKHEIFIPKGYTTCADKIGTDMAVQPIDIHKCNNILEGRFITLQIVSDCKNDRIDCNMPHDQRKLHQLHVAEVQVIGCRKEIYDGECRAGTDHLRLRLYRKILTTGFEAQAFCHRRGGRLISTKTMATADLLTTWTKSMLDVFWIGGSNVGYDGSWKLEDGSEIYDKWRPNENDGTANNTCLAIEKGQRVTKQCNDESQKAGAICEIDGFYECPILTVWRNYSDGAYRLEYYDISFPDVHQASRYCQEIGGERLANEYGDSNIKSDLEKIYPSIEPNLKFVVSVNEADGNCDVKTTTLAGPLMGGACSNNPISIVCQFDINDVAQQDQSYWESHRVIGSSDILNYPPDCFHFFGSCWLFITDPAQNSIDGVNKYCEKIGGKQLSANTYWRRSVFQLTFDRSPKLAKQDSIVLQAQNEEQNKCHRYKKFTWRETEVDGPDSEDCKPTGVFACELWWCLDDPQLSSDRTDVQLINVTRSQVSHAFYECKDKGMKFPNAQIGEIWSISCSAELNFTWNYTELPNCVEACQDEPQLSENQNDVEIVKINREDAKNPQAFYKCEHSGMKFPDKQVGEEWTVVCNEESNFQWNLTGLPSCVEACQDEPQLLENQNDVEIVKINREDAKNPQAFYKCKQSGMKFPDKQVEEEWPVVCSEESNFQWNLTALPSCVEACLDEPQLSTNRNDVELVKTNREDAKNPLALYKCKHSGMKFPEKQLGEEWLVVCGKESNFQWNLDALPTCVEGCVDDPPEQPEDRSDLQLVNITRSDEAIALYKCNGTGMIFPKQRLGDVLQITCNKDSNFQWKYDVLPECVIVAIASPGS